MSAPILTPLQQAPTPAHDLEPRDTASGGAPRAFLVSQEGEFAGISFAAGDVILCRGEARSGDPVVLVARLGRPRVGTLRGGELLGDAGERCHPGRWRAAGRVVAVMRRAARGWVAELVERGCVVSEQTRVGAAVRDTAAAPAPAKALQRKPSPAAHRQRGAAGELRGRRAPQPVAPEVQLPLFAA